MITTNRMTKYVWAWGLLVPIIEIANIPKGSGDVWYMVASFLSVMLLMAMLLWTGSVLAGLTSKDE